MKTLLLTLLFITTALAEDLTTLKGRTFKDARVMAKTPGAITVSHDGGMVEIRADELTDEQCKKYGIATPPKPAPPVVVAEKPTLGYTTVAGYFASPSPELLDKAVQYCVDKDEAALKKLCDTGLVILLKGGMDVKITDTKIFSGMVKIRPKGQTLELWTQREAVK